MRLLLDTHAFLWFVLGDSRLIGSAGRHAFAGRPETSSSPNPAKA
jgi:PIN domain nuclease of toxin-antitoxin system